MQGYVSQIRLLSIGLTYAFVENSASL